MCKGRMKSAQQSSTDWSEAITLTVADNKPQPVLTVSPLWLSPGDSVTLNCSVTDPSAGWRFYWYKAVPILADNYYSYELLPGSISGTEQDSYIVHGQTHTAGYVCRAGRGDPVFYTLNSEHKFAWSGDVHSSASLTVSPDTVQHFTSESVSLNCKGNSTEWRVRKFTEKSYLASCSNWGTMTGSTCNIGRNWHRDTGVYWCESGSGEFSNAVNITIQEQHIILASPVYPVTEGDSVSLSCKLRRQQFALNVFFYRNGELIQNDTRWELNISAVSKSEEGFYKCKYSQQVSPQSWMSVKAGSRPEGSSFPVEFVIRLVCGIILLPLLLLLYCYKPSKDSCFIRPIQSESTDRGSARSHVVYQNEAEPNECSSPLNDAADSQNVTNSLIELKDIGKKRL
ncbi:immunoglobulin superfamily member 1-like isoform X2 [Sebastes umbrosus]|uniref:immunoglobulin superfamily member 1-like isoform X2 n=1 Tax=Sebastes umbrosus TaxID=72105 RepID=UPI00189EF62D|nr:immunoglobulin superfamily member 1-like isoform X2 [Sebastes umbrosus]